MSEAPEQDPDPPAEDEPTNPTSDELDVEGPNESAPGHEPDEAREQAADARPHPGE